MAHWDESLTMKYISTTALFLLLAAATYQSAQTPAAPASLLGFRNPAAENVAEARFLAKGCVTSIACGSVLADRMHGETPGELAKITPEQISESLGGLPSATFHGAQLACDALAALLDKLPARAISA